MKFDIALSEGVQESATVFIGGESLIATKDHPNWGRIIGMLQDPTTHARASVAETENRIRELFDIQRAIAANFTRLSERVTLSGDTLYLDGDPVHSGLSTAILNFYLAGNDDFVALVAFLEKITTNPNAHSREHLFRWLANNRFAIAPDGDIVAYKGVTGSGTDLWSRTAGKAIVNGTWVTGQIPNVPGTIIEMPRSDVQHNPAVGCSTGLHVSNWQFAKGFAYGGTVVRVKINPRDVVSVPTDSGDQKMRVCRYRVLDVARAEDSELLYVSTNELTRKVVLPESEPPKRSRKAARKAARKAVKPVTQYEFPKYYEDFRLADFMACSFNELRWLAKPDQWDIKVAKPNKDMLARALNREAQARRRLGLGSK